MAEESENLKRGNEKLELEKAELTEQNATLAETNSELASNNENLREFNLTLTADNEKLSADKAELEEQTENLREGLIAMREGDIVFRAGEILSSGVLKGGQTADEVTDAINSLVETASRNIAERYGADEDSSVWIYQPELQEIIEKVSSGGQDMILRITAAGNLMRGEPVRTKLNIFPNNKIYSKGEFIFAKSYDVQNDDDAEFIVQDFLTNINRLATEKGILPDPISGTIGAMNAEQLYEIMDSIDSVRGKIQLSAFAKEDTTSIGPLRLNIKLAEEK